ncbi:MAG: hypothetical protein ABJC10_03265 [Acidobacteriota bacterium]
MFDLYDEFRLLIAVLDEHQIDYALCGGMAKGGTLSVVSRDGLISLKTGVLVRRIWLTFRR